MAKRIIGIAALGIGLAGFLMAAGQTQQGAPAAATAAAAPAKKMITTAPGTFPIVAEKQKMTILTYTPAFVKDFATNEFTKRYEGMTNVAVTWETVPGANMVERVNLLIAGGDYPDVIWPGSFPKHLEMMYGKQGVFIRLNELIDSQMVWLKQSLAQFPEALETVTTPDGTIYSLPFMQDGYHVRVDQAIGGLIWINSTWLKNLGLAAPATTEEFYNVLKAFKEKDPNGNGKADEIAFTSESGIRSVFQIMNAFVPSYVAGDYRGMYLGTDGKIKDAITDPRFKDGLRYINRLYKENLIDQNIFTMNNDLMKQITESPSGIILGAANTSLNGTFNLGGTNHKNYDPLPPFKGPGGVRGIMYTPYLHNSGAMLVSNKMANPEVAMRYVDWFYSEDGIRDSRFGPKDIAWRDAKAGEKAYTGKPATWAQMGAATQVTSNLAWLQHGHPQNLGAVHAKQLGNDDIYATGTPALLSRMFKLYQTAEPYLYKNVIPPMYLSQESVKEVAQIQTDTTAFIDEYIVRFVTGNASLDSDWDGFVKQVNSLGRAKLIALNQTALDARKK
jgi:putative aldouronate transport system substrate-binding protein